MDTTYTGAVVPSVSIENLIQQRAAVMERIGAGLALLREARSIAIAGNIGFPRLRLESNRYVTTTILDDDRIDETMSEIRKEVDSATWAYLMSESGLRSFMDAKAREQWDKDIEKREIPELTRETVEATFKGLYAARGDMFERGVIGVFRSLSWHYRTNKPFRFGKRLVIRFVTHQIISKSDRIGSPNYNKCNELDDLIRVLSVLDGKPQPDHRNGAYVGIGAATREPVRIWEHDYMSVRLHKNGNGHVTFKRMDLVDKMNRILAKHYPDALAYDHAEATR